MAIVLRRPAPPRECELCGQCESADLEVFNNEAAAGKWHSACFHTACKPCLQAHIEAKLPLCEAEAQLAIPCYAPGCRKRLPTGLVRDVSLRACGFADAVDRGGLPCPRCNMFTFLHRPACCEHAVCEHCWSEVLDAQENQCLQAKCWHPDCEGCVQADFWRTVCPKLPMAKLLANVPAEMGRLGALAWRPGPAYASGPVCAVCREIRLALLHCGADCDGHAACEACWVRWAEGQVDRCIEARAVAVRCIWPQCKAAIGQELWNHIVSVSESEELKVISRRLKQRERLQANTLFPPSLQVECPRTGCVGIGYLGYDTVMCFMCEHQWVPAEGGEAVPDVDVEVVMGVAVKKCPKCSEFIEKNGGCDHMTCRCRYEFYWSSLKPYRAT